jgi:hypothetical protein
MKKKIAVITIFDCINYGAFLQTFALKKIIESMGYEYFLINYTSKAIKSRYNFDLLAKQSIIYKIYKLVAYPLDKYISLKFKKNSFNRLNIINLPIKKKAFQEYFDCVIAGSDQIWNFKITDFDEKYFINFVPEYKKIFYAPSFGSTHISKRDEKFIKLNLSPKSKISVREATGKKILENIGFENIKVVSDPTLLLNKSDWEMEMIEPNVDYKYILVYSLHKYEHMRNAIDFLSKRFKLKVIYINTTSMGVIKTFSFKIYNPLEFVGLISKAQIVVTDSFHATLFSVLLNKDFYSFVEGDSKKNNNSRLYDFLTDMNLLDRLIDEKKNIEDKISHKISYDFSNSQIQNFKEQSLNWLKCSIENVTKEIK